MKFPIKLKIFLSLTSLLLVVLGFNLYFSSRLFIKDKTNYVYESGLQRLEDLSYQLQSPVGQTLKNIQPYILLSSENSEQFKSIFKSNELMHFFAYQSNNEPWSEFVKEKKADIKTWFAQNKSKVSFTNKLSLSGVNIAGTNYLQISIAANNFNIISILDFKTFEVLTQSSRLFSYHLVYDDGRNFIPGNKESLKYLNSIFKSSIVKGTKKLKKNNEEMLISYVKIPDFNLILISEIKAKNAFKAAEELITRSFYIGMIILGTTIIISLIFSTRLTKPIGQLYRATQSFRDGNFDQKVHIKTRDELKTLGEGFNSMAEQIGALLEDQKKMILKLEDYNQNLEKMVADRTARLQEANNFIEAMINSLNQGLLVFDQKLNVADIYTKSCETIFETEVKSKKYSDVLSLSEKDQGVLQKGVDLIFSEKLPFQSSVNLITKNKIIGESFDDKDFKHIALEYFPMRSKDDDKLTHIVVVATDKTEEVKAVEAFKEKEAYVNMITKLVGNKKQFMNYLNDVQKSFDIIGKELEKDKPNLDLMLMQYHTINGGSGTYSAMALQKKARSNEQHIIDSKEAGGEVPLKELFDQYNKAVTIYKDLQEEINKVLGSNLHKIEVDKAAVDELYKRIKGLIDTPTNQFFEDQFYNEPVVNYITEYITLANTIARKTGKKIHPLEIVGGDTRIPPKKIDSFFSSLVHLFRNCVDHGIEKPNQRTKLEKDPKGKITISFDKKAKDAHQELKIVMTDDGGGINPEKIRSKWLELHPGDQSIHTIADEEVIYKIFDPTFSTTDQLSEFSGRGVGMSAIKETVEELGGHVKLLSEINKGSRFEFVLPIQ